MGNQYEIKPTNFRSNNNPLFRERITTSNKPLPNSNKLIPNRKLFQNNMTNGNRPIIINEKLYKNPTAPVMPRKKILIRTREGNKKNKNKIANIIAKYKNIKSIEKSKINYNNIYKTIPKIRELLYEKTNLFNTENNKEKLENILNILREIQEKKITQGNKQYLTYVKKNITPLLKYNNKSINKKINNIEKNISELSKLGKSVEVPYKSGLIKQKIENFLITTQFDQETKQKLEGYIKNLNKKIGK